LAVAMRDHISYDSASPGFDSRPMHDPAPVPCRPQPFVFKREWE
jgi:hypothetical protein